MASVRLNFIWNASYQVLRIIVPLVTMPYLSRVLGADLLGTYSYTFTVANYFILFALLGINQYGVRRIAIARAAGDESREFCSIFAMQVGSGLLVSVAYLVYALLCDSSLQAYSFIWFVWVASESFDVAWLFFGREQFRAIAVRNLAVKVAVVAGIFLLVHSQADLWIYCALQALGSSISVLVLWPMLRGTISFARPTWAEVRRHIKPNLILFAPQIAISFYTQLGKVLLGSMSSMAEVGFYDYSDKISTIPLAVIQALGTVMLPHMSKLAAAGDDEAAQASIDNSIWFASMLSCAFAFGIMGVSREFVPLFFGPGYDPVKIMMPALALIIPIVAWSNVFGIQCLLPYGRDRAYFISVAVGAVVNVALNLALIPHFQGMGAVWSTVAAELSVVVCQIGFLWGKLPFARWFARTIPFIAIGAVMCFVVRGVGEALGATVYGLAIQIVIGGAVYLLLSLLWMLLTHDAHIALFKTRHKVR